MRPARTGVIVLLAALVGIAVGLPFLGKAFHIDDTHILMIARQIIEKPLDPLGADVHWIDDPEPLFRSWNPPGLAYYVAPFLAAFGPSEPALHGAMLLFLAMLGAATALLALRFAGAAGWAVPFLLLSPAVVVSTNVMADIPALALTALGLALFIRGVDGDRAAPILAGGVLVGLAAFVKYSAATMLPLLALYALLRRSRRGAFAFLPVAILLGAWTVQNFHYYGNSHILHLVADRTAEEVVRPWPEKLWSALAVGGASLFLLPVLLVGGAARRRFRFLFAAGASGIATIAGVRLRYGGESGFQFLFWAATGAALLVAALLIAGPRSDPPPAERKGDGAFLAGWFLLPFLFGVFLVPFQAVRHGLPWLLPLVIILARAARGAGRPVRAVACAALLLQGGTAFLVAFADREYAETYRDFASEAAKTLAMGGTPVWFAGHWGWQEYALRQGFRPVSLHGPRPSEGDLVVIPKLAHKGTPPGDLLARLERVLRREYGSSLPVRTMYGPGFYGMTGPAPPYLFRRTKELETFDVYRMRGSG
ncbi:MAG: glycosyltransferase family 39 protein [Candidatus Eisenbacteria bacterium]